MNEQHEEYMALARELMRRCMAEDDITDLHSWLQERINKMRGLGDDKDGLLLWEDTFGFYDAILAKREEYSNTPADQRKELTWPWSSWNKQIDPLPAGFLAVISAGDGQGKTMYAEVIAEDWAKKRNRIAYVHFELNHSVMLDRRCVRHTGVSMREAKTGQFSREQRQAIFDAHNRLRSWDGGITYQHSAGWTMEQTITRLRQLRAENICDAVVIDYLEKSAPSSRQLKLFGSNTNQREADNVEQLKTFAETSEVPVVMLAQMNKGSKTAGIDRVDRTGIRGAGEKTEKANLVILLNREWDEMQKTYSPLVDVRVDKNTLGPTCSFQQVMKPEFFRIHDLAE